MAAVKALPEEAAGVITHALVALVGVRQTDSGAILARAGVTFPAPPAEAVFLRPTFQEATSQVPRAHRDPAVGVSLRAARCLLRPALVPPLAAEPRSCPLGIHQVAAREPAPRKNLPQVPNHQTEVREPDQPASRHNFLRKVRAIFSVRRLEPVVPLLAPLLLGTVRVSSRQIGAVLVKDALALKSGRIGAIVRKIAMTNGTSGWITAAKPGPNGASNARNGAINSRTIATSVGIICKVVAMIARNGATNDARIGSNIGKISGITAPTARKRSGTTRRIFTIMFSTMPGGGVGVGPDTGPAIIRSTRGGGGELPPGVRSRLMPPCLRNLNTSTTG